MKIDDKRITTLYLPVIDIINEVIPHFKKQHFVGIRKIALFDSKYRKGPNESGISMGRYCAVPGTKTADIEMYFEFYDILPLELKTSKLYLTYLVVSTLMHEVYHHIIRGQHRLRQPKAKKEEMQADRWGDGAVGHIFNKLYPREQYEPEWKKIQDILRDINQI